MQESLNWIDIKSISIFLSFAGAFFWLGYYFYQKRRIEHLRYEISVSNAEHKVRSYSDGYLLELLLKHDDINLKVLLEVYGVNEHEHHFIYEPKNSRIHKYLTIQRDLRKALKQSLNKEKYPEVKDKILGFIEECDTKIQSLLDRKPFSGLEDPEKSLLIDILEELPNDKEMPKQKLLQLADIIKNKYQNIENLQIENSKAATWTKWGTFGTIFFGILSIVLSVITINS